jgi:putative ribosome biogenesis GTPase RsgA
MTNTDELKRLSKEARLGDLEIVSAGTFSRLVRVYSRKAGVYLTDVIDRDNAALIVAAVNALPELLERVRRLERALQAIAKEQSATTATEAADRMQFIARAALKETP